ncbi:hypothetical protein V6N13_004585 [Hibiscus sabdariffa]
MVKLRDPVISPTQRITWRCNSGLNDGKASGVDLVGGYYDASDNTVVQAVYKPFASTSHTYQPVSGGGEVERW